MDVSIVIPVYNSSKTLEILTEEITSVFQGTNYNYEVLFIDDCSTDDSWEILKNINKKNKHFRICKLAKNIGQWMATLAGISRAKGQAIVTIDDDLEYDTKDIIKLLDYYLKNNYYIVYGVPTEKKNRDIYYKLFFKVRDRFMRKFFNKTQTESFKIFNRKIYLNEDNTMRSFLHFEAYTKLVVAEKFVQQIDANYRKRYFGNSNHTLLMKFKIILNYGIEYFISPFKYLLYICCLLFSIIILSKYVYVPKIILFFTEFGLLAATLIIFGILGKYLSSLYFKLKGLPEFTIIEEF